jgi:festuclavine dehydrogenase
MKFAYMVSVAENLIEPGLVYTINQLNTIFTATQDGKIPFISADDIADVAYHALTDDKAPNCDLRVLGPEVLTYDEVRQLNLYASFE